MMACHLRQTSKLISLYALTKVPLELANDEALQPIQLLVTMDRRKRQPLNELGALLRITLLRLLLLMEIMYKAVIKWTLMFL